MEFLQFTFAFFAAASLVAVTALAALLVRTFTGKSIGKPGYPPVAGTTFSLLFYFDRLHDYLTGKAARNPTFRFLAPDHSILYTADPRNVEHVLKTEFEKYPKGPHNHGILEDLLGDGIFSVDGDRWKLQRKLASYEFSTRVLRDFSSTVFRTNASRLVKMVSEFSKADRDFDMQDLLMKSTLDSIFKVGFGVDLNCLAEASKEAVLFMRAFDESNSLTGWRFFDPLWKLKRFLNKGREASLRKNVSIVHEFVGELVKKRRAQLEAKQDCSEREDILTRFLMESKKDPETMSDKYLADIILNFMIAGKDTTANTLSWFFYRICRNPLVQERIAQEISKFMPELGNEDDPDRFASNISDHVLENMHYLHATLAETLRLHPAVPADARLATADDTLPDGFRVKRGDVVFYTSYAMGRMRYNWGDDATEFRPERWLKSGVFQPESPFKFIAFHGGPRSCLGRDFAYRQMKIFSIALLRFFRFELAGGKSGVTYRTMLTLHLDHGLHLCAVPRSP